MRVAALVSIAAGLAAYLLASAGLQEQSVVLAVIVIVSSLAWSGVFERHPPAPLLRVRVPARPMNGTRASQGLHDTMRRWEDQGRMS